RRFEQSAVATPWRRVAQRELWLQTPIGEQPDDWLRSIPTRTKPLLDGVLSDDCWQAAKELFLREPDPAESSSRPLDPQEDQPTPRSTSKVRSAGQSSSTARSGNHSRSERATKSSLDGEASQPRAFAMLAHDERN